jgi:predicted metalloprotease with PDZ domain
VALPNAPQLPQSKPEAVKFTDDPMLFAAIPLGGYQDTENPYTSYDEFKQIVVAEAASLGADLVVVLSTRADVENLFPQTPKTVGFLCFASVRPKGTLGIRWEPEDVKQKKHIIRKFTSTSLAPACGLKIGDKVIAVNGIDVLDVRNYNAEVLRWEPGQEVLVSVVRDGTETKIPVRTIPNE